MISADRLSPGAFGGALPRADSEIYAVLGFENLNCDRYPTSWAANRE